MSDIEYSVITSDVIKSFDKSCPFKNELTTNLKGRLLNSFLASGDSCHLLVTFANSSDPDQDQHNVGPDLDPNH